jgi:hypothetical protein
VMRGRLLLAGTAVSFGLVFLPGLTHAAGAATCGYPAVNCSQPQLTNNAAASAPEGNAAVSSPSEAPSSGSLPFTGADVAELSAIGVAALGAGTLLARRSRSRQA